MTLLLLLLLLLQDIDDFFQNARDTANSQAASIQQSSNVCTQLNSVQLISDLFVVLICCYLYLI